MASRLFFGFLVLFTLVSFVPPGVSKEIVNLPVKIDGDLPVLVRARVTNTVRDIVMAVVPDEVPMTKEELTEEATTRGFAALRAFFAGTSSETKPYDKWKVQAQHLPGEVGKLFAVIEQARIDSDARTCHTLEVSVDGASAGDWTAYCLARVTRDARRCDQIDPVTLPPLKALCDEELR